MVPAVRGYQINTAVFALLSAGHTHLAREWTSNVQFKNLPRTIQAYARAGWYQGSVFFLIMSLVNYRWSKTNTGRLTDPIDKAIAALNILLLWASAVWYKKNGIKQATAAVGVSGLLQAYAAFVARE
ncbi:hypothetical protein DTO166G4_8115 [Paecilomyces variotii]|nr:hypothetical protein DTO166G4_8115 [Paecilomyces variotii]KAJ9241598.1 hypothetical protein DTO166G5_1219 [Paecilomyces variotii]KAJ9262075.1 hypothetical protein DTO195F2_3777 [Paecilomyces variotii]KAJ9400805.1 hypothetical protein DTO282F9_2373 [Paecilomyces variotii]